jgi:hypothetical protein
MWLFSNPGWSITLCILCKCVYSAMYLCVVLLGVFNCCTGGNVNTSKVSQSLKWVYRLYCLQVNGILRNENLNYKIYSSFHMTKIITNVRERYQESKYFVGKDGNATWATITILLFSTSSSFIQSDLQWMEIHAIKEQVALGHLSSRIPASRL